MTLRSRRHPVFAALALPGGVLTAVLAWSACSVSELSYLGKSCTGTCPEGLVCVENVCARSPLEAGALAEASGPPNTDAAADGGACPVSAAIDPCDVLPKFTGVQQVDGRGDDFCGIPEFVFNPYKEQLANGPAAKNPALSFNATLKAAWSGGADAALHLFVHVPKWPLAYLGPSIWNGDAFEVFLAGSAPADLTGDVEGDPGTIQVILAPSVDAGGGGTAFVYKVNQDFHQANDSGGGLPPSFPFAVRVEPLVGYDVELEIPWSTLGPPSPTAGATVGFDVGMDVALPTEDGGIEVYQAFHKILALSVGQSPNGNCGANPHPSCDDRTWCQPTLGDR